jgi:tRNA1Val (adenine37-N6)-methyltransferase
MKVCTDSCILGAYANAKPASQVLDIGAGTGLLSLMLAQRSGANITALEINQDAAAQAAGNFAASPWAGRITMHPESLQQFRLKNKQLFDLIISNPPFFQASQRSPDAAVNLARHTETLTFQEIIGFAKDFLTPETGKLLILLPPPEMLTFEKLAQNSVFFKTKSLQIFTQTNGKRIRIIQEFGLNRVAYPGSEILFIRNPDQTYTSQFRELLKEYYLIF